MNVSSDILLSKYSVQLGKIAQKISGRNFLKDIDGGVDFIDTIA